MPEYTAFQIGKDVVMGAVALYAATLSTFNWRQNLRRDRRELKVTFDLERSKFGFGNIAIIVVTNVGHRVVVVTRACVDLDDGEQISVSEYAYEDGPIESFKLPCELKDGMSAKFYYSFNKLTDLYFEKEIDTIRLRSVCVDSTGAEWRGEWWEMPVKEAAEL